MAYVDHPTNNIARSLFLKTCSSSIAEDETAGTPVLGTKTINLVVKLNEEFHAILKEAEQSATSRAHEVTEKNSAMDRADLFLHHLWIGVKNKAIREGYPAAYLTYFGLPLSGIIPKTNATSAIFPMIDKTIEGEAQAVAAGYAPMAHPTIEELKAVKEIAEKELSDVSVADKAVDAHSTQLSAIREKVDKLAKDIVLEFRFLLRDEDESSQRRIMRKYGIVFKTDSESADTPVTE